MTQTTMLSEDLTIRMLHDTERDELHRLAERDSSQAPPGSVLGAFTGGELVAAASLEAGCVVADPFTRTAEVRAMLTRRLGQLRAALKAGS